MLHSVQKIFCYLHHLFSAPCICDPNQITVDRGQVNQQQYYNGQQAQITCTVSGAQLFLTTVDTSAMLINNQNAYDLGTAPTCTNGVWQTETVFKCRGLLLVCNVCLNLVHRDGEKSLLPN